jgi:MFS family permease
MNKYGRKNTLIYGILVIAISLMTLCIFTYSFIGILSIFIFMIAFSLSSGPVNINIKKYSTIINQFYINNFIKITYVYFAEVLDKKKLINSVAVLWFGCVMIGLVFPNLVLIVGKI